MRVFGGFATEITNTILGNLLTNLLGEPLTAEKIKNAQVGPFTTRYHWNQYDNQINTDANEVHRNNYGTNADLFTSGMFTGASAIVQAVESAGSGQPTDIVNELSGMSVSDTMKGEGGYEFQEYNNQARSAMTVVDLVPTENKEFWDAPVQPGSPLKTYGKDVTTLSEDNTSCSLN